VVEPMMPHNRVGVTKGDITLGACDALSGQMADRGKPVVSGGRSYFSYINAHGGINGRKIKLISVDDQYNADLAIDTFNTYLKNKVFLGTLFQGTPTAAKYVPMAETNKMPMVGFSTGADFITNPLHKYVFQIRASYANEASQQVDVLWNVLNRRKIAVVYQNDAFGASCRSGVVAALAKHENALPAAEISFPRLSHDTAPIIEQLRAANPDAVILGCTGDMLPMLVRGRNKLGNNIQLVAFSVSTDLLVKEAGKEANGVLITQVVPFTRKKLPTVQLFERLIRANEHQEPGMSSFEGFLMAMVVAEGLKRAGPDLTRDKFLSAMESTHDLDMGLGPQFRVTFSPTMHDAFRGGIYFTTIKNGTVAEISDWKNFKKSRGTEP